MRLLEETRRQPLLGVPKMRRRDARTPGQVTREKQLVLPGAPAGKEEEMLFGFPEQHLPLLESTTKQEPSVSGSEPQGACEGVFVQFPNHWLCVLELEAGGCCGGRVHRGAGPMSWSSSPGDAAGTAVPAQPSGPQEEAGK